MNLVERLLGLDESGERAVLFTVLEGEGAGGKLLAPTGTGAEAEWVEEPSYFFRLSAWGDRLLAFYNDHPDFIAPESRRNEVISFVKGGLQDLSISRTTFTWGVPVPVEGYGSKRIYVWFDAVIGYLAATREWAQKSSDADAWKRYWQDPAVRAYYFIGKDNIPFHTIIWPAMIEA